MKKFLKRSLALLLCLLLATGASVAAMAVETVSGICYRNRWEYNGKGRLTIYPQEYKTYYVFYEWGWDENDDYYEYWYYTDNAGVTHYLDPEDYYIIDYIEETGEYLIKERDYYYDDVFEAVDPDDITEIVITEGVTGVDIYDLYRCTNV